MTYGAKAKCADAKPWFDLINILCNNCIAFVGFPNTFLNRKEDVMVKVQYFEGLECYDTKEFKTLLAGLKAAKQYVGDGDHVLIDGVKYASTDSIYAAIGRLSV